MLELIYCHLSGLLWAKHGSHDRLDIQVLRHVRVATVRQPTESVFNLSVPGSIVLPLDLLHILDCIEGEIDPSPEYVPDGVTIHSEAPENGLYVPA